MLLLVPLFEWYTEPVADTLVKPNQVGKLNVFGFAFTSPDCALSGREVGSLIILIPAEVNSLHTNITLASSSLSERKVFAVTLEGVTNCANILAVDLTIII
jgi:hypothetical protein